MGTRRGLAENMGCFSCLLDANHYLKKGGNGQFPTGEDGFLKEDISPKAAKFEVYSETVVID